jgi:glycosyltransferase involved in cell wall biosynthesis
MSKPVDISIVIAAHHGASTLEACLRAVAAEIARADNARVEIIIAAAGDMQHVAAHGVRTEIVRLPQSAGVPALRATGLRVAKGDILALLEDHLTPTSGWLAALIEAHRRFPEAMVIGGAVDPINTHRIVDWAGYFCEYGAHMSPISKGETKLLTGANVSYKRAAIERLHEFITDWETTWHEILAREGYPLRAEPRMIVGHRHCFAARAFLRERLKYGYDYARVRCRRLSPFQRWVRAIAAPLLPAILIARLARSVCRKRRNRFAFVSALPWMLLFFSAWALGEGTGYVAGKRSELGAAR